MSSGFERERSESVPHPPRCRSLAHQEAAGEYGDDRAGRRKKLRAATLAHRRGQGHRTDRRGNFIINRRGAFSRQPSRDRSTLTPVTETRWRAADGANRQAQQDVRIEGTRPDDRNCAGHLLARRCAATPARRPRAAAARAPASRHMCKARAAPERGSPREVKRSQKSERTTGQRNTIRIDGASCRNATYDVLCGLFASALRRPMTQSLPVCCETTCAHAHTAQCPDSSRPVPHRLDLKLISCPHCPPLPRRVALGAVRADQMERHGKALARGHACAGARRGPRGTGF